MAQTKAQLLNPLNGSINVSGIVTSGGFKVGTGISIVGTGIAATTFYGDGSQLTGITSGATLSAGSGDQRVVLTSLTSGTMTSAATDAELTYNSDTDTLTATNFSGDLTGDVTGNADTATTATNAQGLTGTPDITVNNITGVAATFTGIVTATTLGVNTTSVPTNLYVSGNAAGSVVGLGTTDANTTLDFSTGNNFSLTLTGSIVLSNPTGVTTGQSGIVLISQDGSGSRTCGFGSHWDFPSSTPPTLSTGANALDALTYFVRSSTSIITNSLIGIGTL